MTSPIEVEKPVARWPLSSSRGKKRGARAIKSGSALCCSLMRIPSPLPAPRSKARIRELVIHRRSGARARDRDRGGVRHPPQRLCTADRAPERAVYSPRKHLSGDFIATMIVRRGNCVPKRRTGARDARDHLSPGNYRLSPCLARSRVRRHRSRIAVFTHSVAEHARCRPRISHEAARSRRTTPLPPTPTDG